MTKLSNHEKASIIEGMASYIPHAHLQGICLEEIDGERLTLKLPYRQELVGNPDTGTVHGGAITVLLDQTLGIACIVSDQVGPVMTPTLDLRIDHLGVAPAGMDIYATAWVYKATRRVVFIEGYAWCDSPDDPIAHATGTWVQMTELDISGLADLADREQL